jgi:hypothetical protein
LPRKNNRLLLLFVALTLARSSEPPAFAWNDRGHMTVAYLAYKKLQPATRARVNSLLTRNPKYSDWAASVDQQVPGAGADEKNMMIFMIASTWADGIKRDPAYKQDGSQGGNRPADDPVSGRNTGYADLLMHKYWHFIDTPFATDATPLPAIPTPNVQERIALFRTVLASSSPDELKSYDLTWLLHLVGDVHQPLHAATRVSSAVPDGDAGGNLVKLDCARCELHFFWDDLLGTRSDLHSVIEGARKLPKAKAALAAMTDEKEWITESVGEAQGIVYAPPVGPGNGPFTLTAVYQKKARKLARERIALAGARLANLLNAELK